MQIECSSIDDFVANLEGEEVRHGTIHVDRTKTQESGVAFFVTMHASAVVVKESRCDEGTIEQDVLVLAGEECGMDVMASDGGMEGTKRGDELIERLKSYAVSRGLKVKPGVLGF